MEYSIIVIIIQFIVIIFLNNKQIEPKTSCKDCYYKEGRTSPHPKIKELNEKDGNALLFSQNLMQTSLEKIKLSNHFMLSEKDMKTILKAYEKSFIVGVLMSRVFIRQKET